MGKGGIRWDSPTMSHISGEDNNGRKGRLPFESRRASCCCFAYAQAIAWSAAGSARVPSMKPSLFLPPRALCIALLQSL
ncbi:unnamed protein product [Linum tenue]|uniref:Uncharacterized protein n=1 Tax=Linum tenue TaxID=586396 RepID=A0AAV0NXU0_9ROSI|nr:unnamed protein product [Linum tenue]